MTIQVVKVKGRTKYRLVSKKGRNLGTFDTRAEAERREGQVKFFKHQRSNDRKRKGK